MLKEETETSNVRIIHWRSMKIGHITKHNQPQSFRGQENLYSLCDSEDSHISSPNFQQNNNHFIVDKLLRQLARKADREPSPRDCQYIPK